MGYLAGHERDTVRSGFASGYPDNEPCSYSRIHDCNIITSSSDADGIPCLPMDPDNHTARPYSSD